MVGQLCRISPFRGKGGNVCSRRVSLVAPRPGEGPLTEPTAATQARSATGTVDNAGEHRTHGSAWCSPNSITEKILPGTLALVGVGEEPKRGALVVIAAGNAEVWRPLVPDAASPRESYGLYGAPPPVVPIG